MPTKRTGEMLLILLFGLLHLIILSAAPGFCSDSPNTASKQTTSFFGIVNVSRANIRNEPHAKSKIIGNIANKGTIVRVLECKTGWCRILFEGKEGWILRRFITRCYGDGVINGTRVNVRSGPSLKYKVIRQIPYRGTVVEIVQASESWYKIHSRNIEGWVYKKFITECKSETKDSLKKPTKIKKADPRIKALPSEIRSDRPKDQIVVSDEPEAVGPSKDSDIIENQIERDIVEEPSIETALVQNQIPKKFHIKLGAGYSYINEATRTTYQGYSTEFRIDRSLYPIIRISYYLKEALAIEAGFNYDYYKWELSNTLSGKSSSIHGYTFAIGPQFFWGKNKLPYIEDSRLFAQCGIGYKVLDMTLDSYVKDYDNALGGQFSIGLEKSNFEFRLGYNYFKHTVGNVSPNYVVNRDSDELNLSGPFFDITYNIFSY